MDPKQLFQTLADQIFTCVKIWVNRNVETISSLDSFDFHSHVAGFARIRGILNRRSFGKRPPEIWRLQLLTLPFTARQQREVVLTRFSRTCNYAENRKMSRFGVSILSQNIKMVQKILLSLFACVFLYTSEGSAQRARFDGTGFDDFFSLQSQPQPLTLPAPPQNLSFPGGAPAIRPPAVVLGQPTFTPPVIAQPQFQPQFVQPNVGIATPSFDPFGAGTQPFPVFPSAPRGGGVGNPNFQVPRNLQPAQVAPRAVQPFGNVGPTQPPFNPNFQNQPFLPQSRWPYQGTGTNWLPSIDFSLANQAWSSFPQQLFATSP